MDPAIQSALIGASTAIVLPMIKEIVVHFVKHDHAQKARIKSLTERYTHPLGMSAVSMFYRLHEMIELKRFDYLDETTRTNDFNNYKYISSIYRLASLIGWIRALELESSHLIQDGNSKRERIIAVVSDFKKALADGPHAEVDIIQNLGKLWNIHLPKDENDLHRIANKCDQVRNFTLTNESVKGIKPDDSTEAIKLVMQTLCSANNSEMISDEILSETCARAINILTPKQCWIYRDWQNAIGDEMLVKAQTPIRDFDVIGYGAFEKLYKKNNIWVKRTERVFSNVNFDIKQNDYRPDQLTTILKETAKLLIEIDKWDIASKPFTDETIKLAKKYVS